MNECMSNGLRGVNGPSDGYVVPHRAVGERFGTMPGDQYDREPGQKAWLARMAFRASFESDEIEQMSSTSTEDVPLTLKKEPIIIKGVGHITLFGLNSRFDTDFPAALVGRVAPEELTATLRRINLVLKRHVEVSGRWLIGGLLLCCCSLGCSMWPVICLSRRAVAALEKTLDYENHHLYHKLGMHWSLGRRNVDSRLSEYVLLLDYIPKLPLLVPD
ncbi:unnamed protein product, partial [Mesorhabditis spiculigera]